MPTHPRHILLVEDHDADVELTRKALAAVLYPRTLHTALDGVEGMAFLRRQGRFINAPRPDIVLLDLNMPRKDGREMLREMRADALLITVPVIILTTSASPMDVMNAFKLGANSYVVKPVGFADFVKIVKAIDAFWFEVATLPGDPK